MKMMYREFSDNAWVKGRECTTSPDLFFLQYNEDGDDYWIDADKAKAICVSCPVQSRCLDYAVFGREPEGIWGGKTVEERKRIRSKNSRTLPFFIKGIEPIIDSVVQDYMFAQDVLHAQSKM